MRYTKENTRLILKHTEVIGMSAIIWISQNDKKSFDCLYHEYFKMKRKEVNKKD